MLTRSRAKKCMLKIPTDVMLMMLSNLSFTATVTFSGSCKWARTVVLTYMRHLRSLDVLNVNGVQYVVKHCHRIERPPQITGQSSDPSALMLLLKRWPTELTLAWGVWTPCAITKFMATLPYFALQQLRHLTLVIPSMEEFIVTRFQFHYLDLSSLTIDAEGSCIQSILVSMNCRNWDVLNLSLQGDIYDLSDVLIYTPNMDHSFSVINTCDFQMPCNHDGLFHGLKYLVNAGIDNVFLSNIVQICCVPPNVCGSSRLFVDAIESAAYKTLYGTWKMHRMTCDMIDALLCANYHVETGIFAAEQERAKFLSEEYPSCLTIGSVY